MGWNEDHILEVAKRWKVKFRESGMTAGEFTPQMKQTLISYGWTDKEADRIIQIATK